MMNTISVSLYYNSVTSVLYRIRILFGTITRFLHYNLFSNADKNMP